MKLQLAGTANSCTGLSESRGRSVVRLRRPDEVGEQVDYALIRSAEDVERAKSSGWQSIFVVGDECFGPLHCFERTIVVGGKFDYLDSGDIVGIHQSTKRLRTLYRKKSQHNSFLVTERCNNYCLMCSQPPKDVDDGWILDEIAQALPLVDPSLKTLTFTGGEPLTDWHGFTDVLKKCRDALPNTAVQVLTNGRAFANTEITNAWSAVKHPNLIAAIPVYSAVDSIHDHVVQAKGAFDETILGILKLKDRNERVEVRVVLHALTAPRIAETCRWLARNLPFVDHVALMGMENTGFALANEAVLWIDPVDYRAELAEGVAGLNEAGVSVSIYNLPRCVLEPSVWTFAVQSISDWKNGFVEECERCSERKACSGLFTSGRPRLSRGIRAIAQSGLSPVLDVAP
ncbi:His-Xaa-Ser system radical SAM maturase HxsC [Bradyrhizobium sp. 193]|uniref:His-Xaa-Ser system radical SAM maturase HxsC n=1 Tax=Bradyrhizobium sp. 193 TaxID=2782661 RepID=UPI001FF7D06F|nr:His-Xaa-Ser system radical SAM maturase HxsC [Bradyrhizobium sp. 193]